MTVSASVPSGASLYSTTAADLYATSSWTGAGATRTYICFTRCNGASLRTGTVTGNGLTWTEVGSAANWDTIASPTSRSQTFRARGTATTGATTVDYGAGTDMQGGHIIVVELDGVDGTTNQGVVQAANVGNDSSASPHVGSLSAFASSTNATLACFTEDVNSIPTIEGGGAWSSLDSGTYNSPNTGVRVEFNAGADTSPSVTAATNNWHYAALEIAELVSGGATTNPDVIARSVSVPQASPQAASSITPDVITRSFVIPQAVASGPGNATVTPDVIARSFTIGQATAAGPPYELIMRAEEATATDGSTMTTASVTISGDGSIISVFHGFGSGAANTPTISGWTLMNAAAPAGARSVSTFYRAGTYSGTATIDWGGQTQTFRGYCFVDAFGFDFSNLEVQEDSVSHTSSTVTTTSGDPLALSTFAASDNTTYFALLHGGGSPNLATFDAGMNELMNRDISAESMSCGVAWNDAQDLQPDASWTNAGHYVGHAFELRRSGGAVDATANPDVVALSVTVPQASPTATSTVSPGVISVPVAVPQLAAQASSSVTPAVVARSFTMAQASPTAASTVSPGALARSFVIGQATPDVAGNATVNPAAMAPSFVIPQATATGGTSTTANPGAVSMLIVIPQAQGRAASVVSPGLIAALFTIPQATTDDGSFVHPSGPVGARVATGASSARAVNGPVDAEAM